MRRLFDQMVVRPLNALLSSAELLNRSVGGTQLFDAMVSRMVHTLSSPHGSRPGPRSGQSDSPHRPAPRDGERATARECRARRRAEGGPLE